MRERKGYNPKRKIAPLGEWPQNRCQTFAASVKYGGNPEHKMRPNDYGLTPPYLPRRGKALCDADGEFPRVQAERLLRKAFEHGMASKQTRGKWPQNVWVVDQGLPFEAELENQVTGAYHGYPMPAEDEFRDLVLSEWSRRE